MIQVVKPDICFDLDDVLVPFAETICEEMNKVGTISSIDQYLTYEFNEYHNLGLDVFNELIIDNRIYEKIEPLKGAIEALHQLVNKGFNIHIVTARNHKLLNTTIYTLKWIENNDVPVSSLNVMGGRSITNKSHYYNKLGASLFVDDAVHNIIDAVENSDVLPVVITRPWNKDDKVLNELVKEGRVVRVNSVIELAEQIELV